MAIIAQEVGHPVEFGNLLQSFEDFLLSWSICGFQSTSTPTA
jgi:hypothetical protein